MSVSNLTNTKWRLNDTLNFTNTSTQTFSIDFWNGGGVGDWFSQLRLYYYGGSEIGEYHNRLDYYRKSSADWSVVYGYTPQWRANADKTIFIRGGSSATNSNLIAWLEANATQIELDINDLTNTIWKFSDSVSIPYRVYIPSIGEYGREKFNLNFTSNNEQFTSLTWWQDTDFASMLMDFGNESVADDGDFYNEPYQTIEITGGSDATNPFLINFLLENAEQVVPTPTKTFDLTTLNLSAGTHEIKVKARASGYRDSNFSNSVSYTVSPPSYTINFSITDESHTAGGKVAFRIYDGQDNTGTLLYESLGDTPTLTPQTLTCTSGYLTFEFETYESGDPCSYSFTNTGGVSPASASDIIWGAHDETFAITGNGTITINYIDWDD